MRYTVLQRCTNFLSLLSLEHTVLQRGTNFWRLLSLKHTVLQRGTLPYRFCMPVCFLWFLETGNFQALLCLIPYRKSWIQINLFKCMLIFLFSPHFIEFLHLFTKPFVFLLCAIIHINSLLAPRWIWNDRHL